MKKGIILTILVLFYTCCAFGQKRLTHKEYIEKYKNLAIEDQDIFGIPASIKMAQGLLESDCGNSRLATEANNHFGIKCKSDWTGQTIDHDDDAKGECFRKYSSPEQSFRDHSEFLDRSPRYQSLFDLDMTDYKGWAHGLKAAGYATNPRYAEQLIKIIEDHELYLLDMGETIIASNDIEVKAETMKETTDPETEENATAEKIDVDNYVVSVRNIGGYPVYHNNGSQFIVARHGDTYDRLAMVTGITEKKLRKFNDVNLSEQPRQGEPIYLKAKDKKATNGKLIHIAKEGETLHSISQTYGIKLKKLANLNRLSSSSQLSVGQQVRLM